MSYQVVLSKSAKRDLNNLDKIFQQNMAKHLQSLTTGPRPDGVAKLRGTEDEWRIRVGDYRIIYEIDDDKQIITILRIKHRREVYR
jgi:mRNA interferase RelE/StbE